MSSKPALPGLQVAPRAGLQPWCEAWSQSAVQCTALPVRLGSEALRSPFDTLRWAHAASVRAGWVPRSLRESAAFEQTLMALERALLGPLARQR